MKIFGPIENIMVSFEKMAPFMLRARVVEVGRERLIQIKKKLACLIISTDISENSKNEMLSIFNCPIYQCFTSEEIEAIFGFRGTKVLGLHRSPLTQSVLPLLAPHRIGATENDAAKDK